MPHIDIESLLDPKYRVGELTLLMDGDIYVHRAAAVTDGRMYGVDGSLFRYKKDADKFCVKEGIDKKLITVQYQPEPFNHATNSLKMMLKSIEDSMNVKASSIDFRYYLTTKENYRNDILPHYKWNRLGVDEVIRRCNGDEEEARKILRMNPKTFEKNKGITPRKPEHLERLKDFLSKRYGAVVKPPYEADDLIGMAADELTRLGKNFAIVSLDKDLNCIPGVHFNSVNDEIYNVTPEEARHNFYYQCLLGDDTDNIPGVAGCGPVCAENTIEDLMGAEEAAYYERVKEKWEDYLKDAGVSPTDAFHKSASCLWILQDSVSGTLEEKLWKPPVA